MYIKHWLIFTRFCTIEALPLEVPLFVLQKSKEESKMNNTALGAKIKAIVENFTQELFYDRKT